MKIAIDIGFSASELVEAHDASGITRATHAWITALSADPDAEVILSGRCGDDPLYRGAAAEIFARRFYPRLEVDSGIDSRLRARALSSSVARWYARNRSGPPLVRGAARVVGGLAKLIDLRLARLPGEVKIFASTFLPLPPRDRTGDAERVLILHDLFPLTRTGEANATERGTAAAILSSIDVAQDWVICISSFVRDELLRLSPISPARVFVVPHGVDERFRPVPDDDARRATLARYGLEGPGYFLNVASAQPRKNLACAVAAFARLVAERPSQAFRLVLAGRPSPIHESLLYGMDESIRRRVVFTGTVQDEDLPALYSAARAFVFPSFAEGFGLPLLEAMACGTPVIAADATAIPEATGGAGLLFAPEDPGDCLRAISALLDRPTLVEELRAAGLKRASECRWERSAEMMHQAFASITRNQSES